MTRDDRRARSGRSEAELNSDGQPGKNKLRYDDKAKLILPRTPDADDPAEQLAWLTAVLNRDPRYPITGARWLGVRGPEGLDVELTRAGAGPIFFEPARQIDTPMRLIEALSWQRAKTDWRCLPLRAITAG